MRVKESLNVRFYEIPPPMSSPLVDDDILECEIIENQEKDLEIKENESLNKEIVNIKETKDHPIDSVIGNAQEIWSRRLQTNKTPMSSEAKLTRDEDGESVDDTKYRGMIGSLLYLTASRPDIMFNVCLCARFQEFPKASHLEAVKRIFRYIKGTTHLGLWYPKGTRVETIVYADSDHAGDYVDRKSTSGDSAEKACQQALWMKQALVDYNIVLDDIPVLCDNKGAIDLSKNPVLHSRTKHIEIRHHFLRDNVQKGNISIEKVSSQDNIADILTKPLKQEPFNLLRLGLGLMEPKTFKSFQAFYY
ncbi:hypothetical protein Tco_1074837 [Tanacetum coccineum]